MAIAAGSPGMADANERTPSTASLHALDAVNLFLARASGLTSPLTWQAKTGPGRTSVLSCRQQGLWACRRIARHHPFQAGRCRPWRLDDRRGRADHCALACFSCGARSLGAPGDQRRLPGGGGSCHEPPPRWHAALSEQLGRKFRFDRRAARRLSYRPRQLFFVVSSHILYHCGIGPAAACRPRLQPVFGHSLWQRLRRPASPGAERAGLG
jgi:hypothetical protein